VSHGTYDTTGAFVFCVLARRVFTHDHSKTPSLTWNSAPIARCFWRVVQQPVWWNGAFLKPTSIELICSIS